MHVHKWQAEECLNRALEFREYWIMSACNKIMEGVPTVQVGLVSILAFQSGMISLSVFKNTKANRISALRSALNCRSKEKRGEREEKIENIQPRGEKKSAQMMERGQKRKKNLLEGHRPKRIKYFSGGNGVLKQYFATYTKLLFIQLYFDIGRIIPTVMLNT